MYGWEIKLAYYDSSYSPLSRYQPRRDDDDDDDEEEYGNLALWLEGIDPQIVCSWRS